MDRVQARQLVAHLAQKGWLVLIRRGLYATVPLRAVEPSDWCADAWTIAVRSFSPCHIAGWSACEHWDLTEQEFRDIVIVTATAIR